MQQNESSLSMPPVLLPDIPDRSFSIEAFGAIGNGLFDNTGAFKKTMDACEAAGGGKVVIPPGVWLTGPIALKSRVELHAQEGALVLFSRCFEDYPLIVSSFEGNETVRCMSPLDGDQLEHVAITGKGLFDGSGEAWRPVKRFKMTEHQWKKLLASGGVLDATGSIWWPTEAALKGSSEVQRLLREGSSRIEDFFSVRDYLRPNLLSLRNCSRVLLDGPTFQNSPGWCLHPWACEHVTVQNVKVKNPWFAQNGDGLDIDSCRYVRVENSSFDVGDDAICLKAGKDEAGRRLGKPCEHISISGCTVYHGHGGFVVGSEMSGGVRNVRVSDCTFIGTDVGLRFKSTRGRGGVVENIQIERIRMKDIAGEAISFHMFYGLSDREIHDGAVPVSVGTPVFRNIEIRDVACVGARRAVIVKGLPEMPLERLFIGGLTIQSDLGILCQNGNNITFSQVRLVIKEGQPVSTENCINTEFLGVETEKEAEI